MPQINYINNKKLRILEMLIEYLIRYFIHLRTVKNFLAWNPDETITLISLL